MVKLKRSPKHLELDINVAKYGQFCIFARQAANSVWHENPCAAEYCWPCLLLPLQVDFHAKKHAKIVW